MRLLTTLVACAIGLVTAFANQGDGIVTGNGSGQTPQGTTMNGQVFGSGQDGHTYGSAQLDENANGGGFSQYGCLLNRIIVTQVTAVYCVPVDPWHCLGVLEGTCLFNGRWGILHLEVLDTSRGKDTILVQVRGYWGELLYERIFQTPGGQFKVIPDPTP